MHPTSSTTSESASRAAWMDGAPAALEAGPGVVQRCGAIDAHHPTTVVASRAVAATG